MIKPFKSLQYLRLFEYTLFGVRSDYESQALQLADFENCASAALSQSEKRVFWPSFWLV